MGGGYQQFGRDFSAIAAKLHRMTIRTAILTLSCAAAALTAAACSSTRDTVGGTAGMAREETTDALEDAAGGCGWRMRLWKPTTSAPAMVAAPATVAAPEKRAAATRSRPLSRRPLRRLS